MPKVSVEIESSIQHSARTRQVSAMFDVPAQEKCHLSWKFDMPIESMDWSVGLIVGPSGSGKSTVMKHVFGEPPASTWGPRPVVDELAPGRSIQDISEICQSVGFNTIPAWLRPYSVLSNGEKFRVDVAQSLLSDASPIVVDEFTSFVDRQVAKIVSHSVQKFIRRKERKLVAVTCHYDVIDWLQPDWIVDMADQTFQRRLLQGRPSIECEVRRVPYEVWRVFAPFHYLSAEMTKAARCFALYANGRLAAFAGVIHKPHSRIANIKGVSRLVTLPDWQGCGLAMALVDQIGAAYKATDRILHTYPAHPALIRSFDKSPRWQLRHEPGVKGVTRATAVRRVANVEKGASSFSSRPCATFRYAGPAMADLTQAQRLLGA